MLDISHFAPLVTFGDFQQGFTNFLCLTWSAVISVTQMITIMSSWSQYLRSYNAKHATMSFPALQMHNSNMTVVSGSKSYPQSWCHMPSLFWEISEISHILQPLMTFGDFQQGFTNFLCLTSSVVISVTQLSQSCHLEVDTSEVMKENVSMSFPALQMHISNMTVVSGSKSYPQIWCHMPTQFSEICKISQV